MTTQIIVYEVFQGLSIAVREIFFPNGVTQIKLVLFIDCTKIMDVAIVMSSTGLLICILKTVVCHFDCHCFGFLEPEVIKVTIFRLEGGGVPNVSF